MPILPPSHIRALTCLLLLAAGRLWAQDPHFSQMDKAPLYLNAALAGAGDWDARAGAQWREQWAAVPVAYQTFSAFYDQKINPPGFPIAGLAAGLVLLHDRAGDGRLGWTQAGARLSYSRPLAEQHTLAAGLGADVGQRAFRPERLAFGDQYNGEFYDPDQASAEAFTNTARGFFSLSAGLHYTYRGYRSRTRVGAGVAASHLNAPLMGFRDDSPLVLPAFWRVHTRSTIEINGDWDATARGHYFQQGTYREWLAGAGARYHLVADKATVALGLTLAYRGADAFIFLLEADWGQWQVGLSYDINTSPFQAATRSRGGPEMAVHYLIFKAKPPEAFKSCPIF